MNLTGEETVVTFLTVQLNNFTPFYSVSVQKLLLQPAAQRDERNSQHTDCWSTDVVALWLMVFLHSAFVRLYRR